MLLFVFILHFTCCLFSLLDDATCVQVPVLGSLKAYLVYGDSKGVSSERAGEKDTATQRIPYEYIDEVEENVKDYARKDVSASVVQNEDDDEKVSHGEGEEDKAGEDLVRADVAKFADNIYLETVNLISNIDKEQFNNSNKVLKKFRPIYLKKVNRDSIGRTGQVQSVDMLYTIVNTAHRILKNIIVKNIDVVESTGLLKPVDALKEKQYSDICQEYGVCRASLQLAEYLYDVTKIVRNLPDNKFAELIPNLFGQLKAIDKSKIMGRKYEAMFNGGLDFYKTSPAKGMRRYVDVVLMLLMLKNLPFVSEHSNYFKIVKVINENTNIDQASALKLVKYRQELAAWKDNVPIDLTATLNGMTNAVKSQTIDKWNGGALDSVKTTIGNAIDSYRALHPITGKSKRLSKRKRKNRVLHFFK